MRKCLGLLAAAVCVGVTVTSVAQAGDRAARPGKDVTIRLLSSASQYGYSQMKMRGSDPVFVSDKPLLSESEIVSVSDLDGGLQLALTPEALAKVRDSGASQVALVQGGKLLATPQLATSATESAVQLTGLSTGEVNRLSRAIQARAVVPVGAMFQVVAREESVQPGGTVTVDLFLSGAANVRTYQVAVEATGGDSGSLTRREGWIDADRPDYVFGTAQVIKAVDDVHGRAGAVLFDGGVNAMTQAYLGTFTFEASSDAAGDFVISARVGSDTFVGDPDLQQLPYRVQGSTIHVGS